MSSDKTMCCGSVLLAVAVAVAVWYLIEYSFAYDSAHCVDIVETNALCQKRASYIAFLVLIIILGGSSLGFFASLRFPTMLKRRRR